MGAYLNKPVTEKETESGGNGRIKYAATSMQGWRVNQEDAHNCLVDLLEGWALFAVYDGHGGPEVAKYTADKFPDFLMKREFWKNDDVVKALQDVFVDFDDHLRSEAAIKQLKVIAGHIKEKKTDETDAEKADMYDEASLPLHELLAKYGVRLVQNGVSGGIAGTLLNNGDESGDDEDEEEEDEESGEADDKADAKPEKSASEEIKQPAEKEDEQKKCVTKRACESPVQDDAKRPKTEAPEDVKESRTESVTTGETAKQEQNGPATIQENGKHDEDVSNGGDGSDATPIVPKMREKTVHEPKPKEKVEAIQPSAEGDSSDDDDYVVEDEESGDGESDDDEDEELELDEEDEFVATGEVPGEDSGTTACVCLMNDKQILVANIGDSRAVLCRGGKAFDLSFDHKPEDEVENTRIRKAGGRVTEDGRVNGGLNLSRAFGDHCYKKNSGLPLAEQMISAFPDVKTEDFTEDDTFLIVACDGIWNSMDSQQAITFVKERMEKGLELEKIVEEICTACLAENTAGDGTGCDNMTVILVDLVAKKSAST